MADDELERKTLYSAGEKVPAGEYVCAECQNPDSTQILDKDGEKLKLCPFCNGLIWFRI